MNVKQKRNLCKKNEFHVDMGKLKSGESYAQCFAIFLNREDCKKRGVTPFTRYRQMYACFQEELSHLSDAGFWDVLKTGKKPIVASHSCARALCANSRNLSDEMLKALGNAGGVVGVNFFRLFLAKQNDESRIEQVVAHVRHMVSCAGVESVAFGSDFDGIDERVEWKNFSGMQLVVEALGRYQKGYGVQSEKLSEGKYEVTMLFYNGGAKLTCEESPTLEDLKSLEAQGVEILTCGTCLNYYGLTERLQVESVSNMYAIAEKLTQAGHIIKP